jgi:hypothetical protein
MIARAGYAGLQRSGFQQGGELGKVHGGTVQSLRMRNPSLHFAPMSDSLRH